MMMPTLSARTIAAALGQFPPTDEQVAVIEAPLAPALVVAGAGSGKTETMSARVVWVVANALVRRDEVLGLTFTRKAAGELAERIHARLARLAECERRGLLPHLGALHAAGALDELFAIERDRDAGLIPGHVLEHRRATHLDRLAVSVGATAVDGGSDESMLHRPTVLTYNSFADAVVRENAVRVGRDPEVSVLSEAAAWLLMRRIVFASDDVRLEDIPFAPSTIIDSALRIARDGADNLVDFDRLAAFGAEFADVIRLPSGKRDGTDYADVVGWSGAVGALPVLVDLARAYDSEKRRLGVIDFSDQVAGALTAARAEPEVGAELRARFRIVLLDEYQDTSVVQTTLLAELFGGGAVMAVGDPHQAIYGWRGASAGNLGGFSSAFSPDRPSTTYSLMTSWRNSESVLDVANAILAPIAPRSAVPVGQLRPRPGAPVGVVDIVQQQHVEAEADAVAAWFADVRAERAAGGRTTTGAVLFRAKKHMVRFADALGRRGIPHRILGLGGLLTTPEVVDVVSALRVISDPAAGSALIRLLSGPRWSIGLGDLKGLRDLAKRIAETDDAMQPLPAEVRRALRGSASDDDGSIVDALDVIGRLPSEHGWLAEITESGRARLADAAATFAGLRRAVGLPIPELVRLIESELRLDVELAVNETRGPARIASAQLRAFVDEVHGFLAADETGSLTALLAWLDRAEDLDDFAPRTEPPEPDVVQLLTIHGSKGLEWDAVAVVRLVKDELPGAIRGKQTWLGFGVLPNEFRGDAAWLPELEWRHAQTQKELVDLVKRSAKSEVPLTFEEANQDRHRDEETRLAYVAVTRARDRLLLTASPWAGTTMPRPASAYLIAAAEAVSVELAPDDADADAFQAEQRLLHWPMDPLGDRRDAVTDAAAAVDSARARVQAVVPDPELDLLLRERAVREQPTVPTAPTRVPASRFKDFVTNWDDTVASVSRPMPERPFRQTRLGTLFHAWVEHRSGMAGRGSSIDGGLWALDEDDTSGEGSARDAADMATLRATFEASEWADLAPIEVETELNFPITLAGETHVVICKLDAVYRRGDRIEIVDWKTGRPPKDAVEREQRLLQLALYRIGYHRAHGVPLEQIDATLYYVADDLVIREDDAMTEEQLAARWAAARAGALTK